MKESILLLSSLFSAISSVVAGQGVNVVADIKDNTCQSGVSNNGNIDLGVVGVDNFTGNISAKNYHPGEKEFTITVQDCTFQGTGNILSQLHINFRTLSGVMTTGSSQIFANEDNAGAKNVGIVIFFIQDPVSIFNILSTTDSPRSVYLVMPSALDNSSQKFSTRMQKIDPALSVTSDPLISHVLVGIYYE